MRNKILAFLALTLLLVTMLPLTAFAEDSYQAKSVTVSLQDGNVSESKDSDKDLRDAPN